MQGDYNANPAQILGVSGVSTDTIKVFFSNAAVGVVRLNIAYVPA